MSQNNNVEQRLGYRFSDKNLLELALTHRSKNKLNNERLEFLGDALLDLVISELLYKQFPQAREGELTRARASLVKGESLAEIAKVLALGDSIRLGSGEMKSGGHRRASILADALEAIIGAIYLDSGLQDCTDFICRIFEARFQQQDLIVEDKDPKTRLQEWLQARKKKLPVYTIVSEDGTEQNKLFTIVCSVGNLCEPEQAQGDSKRTAEMLAADKVLTKLIQAGNTT